MPEKDTGNKDFTDFWLLFYRTDRLQEFQSAWNQLEKEAQDYETAFGKLVLEDEKDVEYEEVNFFDAINEEHINKNINFKALVVGEALKPYRYPTQVKLSCNFTKGDKCKACGLFIAGGKMEVKVRVNPLELINCPEYHKNLLIRQQIGIVSCGQFKFEALEEKNIQELFLAPIMEEEKMEQRFLARHAYCLGSNIIPNKIYSFYGQSVNHPRDQSIIFYFKKYQEEQSSLDTFQLTDEEIEQLKVFQVKDGQTIRSKLMEIYYDFSLNLSPIIRHRNDIMFACDLIFHSVLEFHFLGSFQRGWGECLIVGDTSTGKTKQAEKLVRHYRSGLIQGAENATIAGLIGGMTKLESSNIMTWGLLPLNHSKIVILDEMSGIEADVISQLTRIRDVGEASRTIAGGPRKTNAKVRLIWISNPRRRSMNLYDSGCDVVRELIGKPEDISKFDFILTVSDEEVKPEQMNIKHLSKPPHKYKSDLCHKLILWAWSRKSNQVIFDEEVEPKILEHSIQMAEKYSPTFPLVLGSTIRLKLAKLSVALACRLFSTDDGINIIVKSEHVDYIKTWLEMIYSKPSFGYEDYSMFHKASEKESVSSKVTIKKDIGRYCKNDETFMRNILNTKRITALEIQDFAQTTKINADQLRANLVNNNFLEKKQGYYVKSDLFRKFLKGELKKEG